MYSAFAYVVFLAGICVSNTQILIHSNPFPFMGLQGGMVQMPQIMSYPHPQLYNNNFRSLLVPTWVYTQNQKPIQDADEKKVMHARSPLATQSLEDASVETPSKPRCFGLLDFLSSKTVASTPGGDLGPPPPLYQGGVISGPDLSQTWNALGNAHGLQAQANSFAGNFPIRLFREGVDDEKRSETTDSADAPTTDMSSVLIANAVEEDQPASTTTKETNNKS